MRIRLFLLSLLCFSCVPVLATPAGTDSESLPVTTVADPAQRQAVEASAARERRQAQAERQQLQKTVQPVKSGNDNASQWMPEARDYDWVQLTSGEWLKGQIKAMYNDNLEFDSEKLDMLMIDWEDVKYLTSYRQVQVNLEGHAPVSGHLQVSSDKVTIANDYEDVEFDRSLLVSLSPAAERELDLWSLKYSFGLNLKSGNTEQVDYTSKFNGKRRTAKSRLLLDYIGNISKTNAGDGALVETINNHRFNAAVDIYVTRYFFYTPLQAEYFRDPFQNIDQRISAGVGLGYTFIETTRLEWNINAGPSFLSTRYLSVQPGEDQRIDTSALVLGTDVDAAMTPTIDFIFKYNIQYSGRDSGGYTHHMIASFESEITGRLDFDVSLLWDRISQPTENDAGEIPRPDDYRLVVGITYTY